MDLLSLKRDMSAIEEGRWVDGEEVRGLGDMRVKVRGASTDAARDLFAAKQRKVDPRDRNADGSLKAPVFRRVLVEVLTEYQLIEIEGLTNGDKPLDTKEVRELLFLPEYQPLADLIMAAVAVVDASRADRAEAVKGN